MESFLLSHLCVCVPLFQNNTTPNSLLEPENRNVGKKLGVATAFMFTLPVLTFFAAQWAFRYKQQPDNWAGAAAIIMVNIIVGSYCYMAYLEDSELDKNKNQTDNDANQPRVGIFKQRVDWFDFFFWLLVEYIIGFVILLSSGVLGKGKNEQFSIGWMTTTHCSDS